MNKLRIFWIGKNDQERHFASAQVDQGEMPVELVFCNSDQEALEMLDNKRPDVVVSARETGLRSVENYASKLAIRYPGTPLLVPSQQMVSRGNVHVYTGFPDQKAWWSQLWSSVQVSIF
jgi:hypothetical protein